MKEQFDKRLVEKIKGSFENYEEPFDPKEWEKFSEAYFDKKESKPFWLWPALISGIAASLVIGFLIWPSVEDISVEDYVTYDQELPNAGQDSPVLDEPVDMRDENLYGSKGEEKAISPDDRPKTTTPSAEIQYSPDLSSAVAAARTSEGINREASRMITADPQALGTVEATSLKKLEMAEVMERESIPVTSDQIPSLQLNVAAIQEKEPLKEEEAQKIINTWAMADLPAKTDKKNKDAGVKWGLVMVPQTASNTTMGLNLGGGLMSEISLTKRLKLDVGVTFARQSLVPGQGQNVAMVMNSTPGHASADQLQQSAVYNTNRASSFMAANMIMPVTPTYELNFSNLDIPINLKYKVMDNPQSGLYLISGLSSMIYLSQSSSETYNISNVGIGQASAFSSNQVQVLTTEITPQEGESTVDLGRMLNLSFGYEYKLTNGTFLSVEPFYKLPIGNMTFVDQQFSIGGVNLRMNFQFKK